MRKVEIQGLVASDSRRTVWVDEITRALLMCRFPHHEIHEGDRFYCLHSIESLGGMTSPDDLISLTWTTPDTLKWEHFSFWAEGTGGWRVRLIEAPTGGAASQTGQVAMLNRNRNSDNVSTAIALDSTAGEVSYDATLATGGETLWNHYIPGSNKTIGLIGSGRDEIVLKQNTKYQLSMFGTDTDVATMFIDWYEHTNKP